MKKIIILISILLLFASCDEELSVALRSTSAPFCDVPVLESSRDGSRAFIKAVWKEDEGADSYVLLRAEESAGEEYLFKEVYRGNDTVFCDEDVRTGGVYLYRLDKTRGLRTITGKDASQILFDMVTEPFDDIPVTTSLSGDANTRGHIRLEWKKDINADWFILYKSKEGDESVFKKIYEGRDCFYSDEDVKDGETLAYRLDKRKGSKIYRAKSYAYHRFSLTDKPFSSKPSLLWSGEDDPCIALSWQEDANADFYILMRRTDGDDEFKAVYTGADIQYMDYDIRGKARFEYRLDKRKGADLYKSERTAIYAITLEHDSAPAVSYMGGESSVEIEWDGDERVEKYILLRAEDDSVFFNSVYEGKQTQFHDSSIEYGKKYRYKISRQLWSTMFESQEEAEIAIQMKPCVLSKKDIVQEEKAIVINWDKDDFADKYMLFRADNAEDAANPSDLVFAKVYEGLETSYRDENISKRMFAYRLVKKCLDTEIACKDDIFFYCTEVTSVFNDTPVAECSYETGSSYVGLSWKKDPNADIYFLMRAEDSTNPDFVEIYRGKGTDYKDMGAVDGIKYLYRLDKKKGLERTNGSTCAYVWFDEGTYDLLDNPQKDRAFELLGTARGCVYDISFAHFNRTMKARDWYKVTIPADYTAKFVFRQEEPTKSAAGINSDVRWLVVGMDSDPKVIRQDEEISITNSGTVQREFVFYLETVNSEWKPNGFKVVYTLRFKGMT